MIKKGAIYGSGAYSYYSGWVNVFFPLINQHFNPYCKPYKDNEEYVMSGLEQASHGMECGLYPNGLATAPVTWKYYDNSFDLKFISGFFGTKQNKNNKEVSPLIGWVIAEKTEDENESRDEYSIRLD